MISLNGADRSDEGLVETFGAEYVGVVARSWLDLLSLHQEIVDNCIVFLTILYANIAETHQIDVGKDADHNRNDCEHEIDGELLVVDGVCVLHGVDRYYNYGKQIDGKLFINQGQQQFIAVVSYWRPQPCSAPLARGKRIPTISTGAGPDNLRNKQFCTNEADLTPVVSWVVHESEVWAHLHSQVSLLFGLVVELVG